MNRKSIITKILLINISIAVIHILLFGVVSSIYAKRLIDEQYIRATAAFDRAYTDFYNEMRRLDDMISLCLNDHSFIFALSNKLDLPFFQKNAGEAAKKLTIIKHSLPYAKNVFAYTRKTDKIIRDTGNIADRKAFTDNFLSPDLPVTPDISDIKDGFYKLNNSGKDAIYVKNLSKYGFVAIHLNTDVFANINKNKPDNLHIYIFDGEYNTYIESDSLRLEASSLESAVNHRRMTIDGTDYYCIVETLSNPEYTGLVLIDSTEIFTPLEYFFDITVISFLALVISSFLMVYLNIKTFIPLKKFTSSFGNSGNTNEISFIENKLHELLYEIYQLSESNTSSKISFPDKITMQYLIYGGQQINDAHLKSMQNRYSFYHLVLIIIQNDDGQPEPLLMMAMEKNLQRDLTAEFINVDRFTMAVVATDADSDAVVSKIIVQFGDCDDNIQIFIGVSQNGTDISTLNIQYTVAYNKIMASRLSLDSRIVYDPNATIPVNTGLNISMQNTLFEHLNAGTYEQCVEIVDSILLGQDQMGLGQFSAVCEDMHRVIDRFSEHGQKNTASPGIDAAGYNTSYMHGKLLDRIRAVMESKGSNHSNMKSRMITYLSDNIAEDLSLERVAGDFSITSIYLSSWFKKNYNINYLTYVSSLRMEEAIRIMHTKKSSKIYEIAKMVGIANTATFIRQFKRHTGITPEQYRRSL